MLSCLNFKLREFREAMLAARRGEFEGEPTSKSGRCSYTPRLKSLLSGPAQANTVVVLLKVSLSDIIERTCARRQEAK